MIRTIYHPLQGELRLNIPLDEIPSLLTQKQGVIWIDVYDETETVYHNILCDLFHFHPLVVNDAWQESNTPRLDDWQQYLYIVLYNTIYQPMVDGDLLQDRELDLFLGPRYLITLHKNQLPVLDLLWEQTQRDMRAFKNGADHLLYLLADAIVEDQIKLLTKIETHLDLLEDQLFDRPKNDLLEQLFNIKRDILQLRRLTAPQRNIFNKLASNEYSMIDSKDRIFFRHLHEHWVQLYDDIEHTHELIIGALDTYWTAVNTRMNDTMKTLTVITVLFMPLTFVTGFFGMNFFQAATVTPTWTSLYTLEIAFAIMVILPILIYWWMRQRNWM